jgi:hypothetical protein
MLYRYDHLFLAGTSLLCNVSGIHDKRHFPSAQIQKYSIPSHNALWPLPRFACRLINFFCFDDYKILNCGGNCALR